MHLDQAAGRKGAQSRKGNLYKRESLAACWCPAGRPYVRESRASHAGGAARLYSRAARAGAGHDWQIGDELFF